MLGNFEQAPTMISDGWGGSAQRMKNFDILDRQRVNGRNRGRRLAKPLLFAGKFLVSAACFWLVLHRIDLRQGLRAVPGFDYRWAAFAVLAMAAEIPLLAFRFREIVLGVAREPARLTYRAALAVTLICNLFAQVVPGVVGEGIRAWFLVRIGYKWREAITSVLIDRCVGIAVLLVFSLVILLLPSQMNALAGYRNVVLAGFGAALGSGALALIFAPEIASLLRLWRHLSWSAALPEDARRVLFGSRGGKIFAAAALIHSVTIVVIWALGKALGLAFSAYDCAVLFVLMVGMTLVPISVGGWGLRELAVVSLLGAYGVAPERALLFSLCFGAVALIAALPGAIVWPFYQLPTKVALQEP
jgi:glycosyltransferase 2 family protein